MSHEGKVVHFNGFRWMVCKQAGLFNRNLELVPIIDGRLNRRIGFDPTGLRKHEMDAIKEQLV